MNNTILKELAKHPTFLSTRDLQDLCKPLEYLNITTFSHLRVFNDNRLTVLCNHPNFLLNYVKKQYYDADPCVNINPEMADIGQYLAWDFVDCYGKTAEMLSDSTHFDFKHVFTVIKKKIEFTDFYHFGTHISDLSFNQVYINNLDVLDRFINFFDLQVKQSKKLIHAYNIHINADQISSNLGIKQNLFINTTPDKRAVINALFSGVHRLTQKESECAKLLIDGNTANEIAILLGLSHRTIEDRINSLKLKFNARNKGDLIVKLLKNI